jgi:hypothetical protein
MEESRDESHSGSIVCEFGSKARGSAMNNDTEEVVDLRRYREGLVLTRVQPPARSRAAPARPTFIAIPIPLLVPIPLIWTMAFITVPFAA